MVPTPVPVRRLISREVKPYPPLEPVSVELTNSHKEEIWVFVSDLRDEKQAKRLKIPTGKSATVKLDRDAGGTAIETWEITLPGGRIQTVVEELEIPPQLLYDMSVYELFSSYTVVGRTKRGPSLANQSMKSPKSVGLYRIPPGDTFQEEKLDIYQEAQRQENPGGVRHIDPTKWK